MRNLILSPTILFVLLLLFFTTESQARSGFWGGKLHVVYHLSEPGKVNFVLNNIRNHLKGGGGEEKLDIVLVIHGPALESFEKMTIPDKAANNVKQIQNQGVKLVACGNTMTNKLIDIEELVGDFAIADEGGVTRIADLQSQGYLYIRP